MKREIYLGDGAYAEQGHWEGQVCVYTSNGVDRLSEVFLDLEMLDRLHEWATQPEGSE